MHGEKPVTLALSQNGSDELLGFALGWLAREDKVDITQEKKTIKAALK